MERGRLQRHCHVFDHGLLQHVDYSNVHHERASSGECRGRKETIGDGARKLRAADHGGFRSAFAVG
jgi:hypothetical protein